MRTQNVENRIRCFAAERICEILEFVDVKADECLFIGLGGGKNLSCFGLELFDCIQACKFVVIETGLCESYYKKCGYKRYHTKNKTYATKHQIHREQIHIDLPKYIIFLIFI